jgi:acetyltransferase
MTPVWSRFAELYPALVEILARSGEVDVVVPVLLQRAATDAATVAGVIGAVERLRADGVAVPVHVCWVAPRSSRAQADTLAAAGVPVFEWPARTARAVGLARAYASARERVHPPAPQPPPFTGPVPGADDPVGVAGLLGGFGIATVPATRCTTPDEAAAAATRFPAVVKLAVAEHRTERGGVRLGLSDAAQVRAAAADLLPAGDVLVSPQLDGVEVAVGGLRDPAFGPVVMVGLGGIWVEVLADVAFALAPLSVAEARDLLVTLQGHALLTGARGGEPVDLAALAGVVAAVGDLMAAVPQIAAVDLNPVLATSAGAIAVDWKLRRH